MRAPIPSTIQSTICVLMYFVQEIMYKVAMEHQKLQVWGWMEVWAIDDLDEVQAHSHLSPPFRFLTLSQTNVILRRRFTSAGSMTTRTYWTRQVWIWRLSHHLTPLQMSVSLESEPISDPLPFRSWRSIRPCRGTTRTSWARQTMPRWGWSCRVGASALLMGGKPPSPFALR